jgi:type II secretory pathway pseudopilin PulG
MNRNRGGYTLIELILVMFLLIMVASLVFSLTAAGSQAWLRLNTAQNSRSDLRTAMSYLEIQIKKADEEGAVSIEPDPFFSEPALRLDWIIENPTIPGQNKATTWIYLHEGRLYEFYTLPGMSLVHAGGRELVKIDNWKLEISSGNLFTITINEDDRQNNEWTRNIYLRSGGMTP